MTHSLSAELVSESADQTRAIGKALGETARPGDLVLLEGELGAGKTCLTQGILWGLGGTEYARSPTFVLMTHYEARLTLYHVDLYRIESAVDLAGLGLDEVISGDGVTVVEWAERAEGLFGDEGLLVRLEHVGDDTRRLRLSAKTERYSSAIDAALSAVGA
ncbi:MAG: tRNA (adenosine(37)-N6)-threonylcarbamoyltransferase complex ATPase subunit type 1 TsaE [Chloroflexi bacterium]|nr:tRNA (adenosine(37)-N6)-threonylcarbamoyltransferase complex ATPase subunit type 1 TsaE [Chloroflexota bacterium]